MKSQNFSRMYNKFRCTREQTSNMDRAIPKIVDASFKVVAAPSNLINTNYLKSQHLVSKLVSMKVKT